MYKVEIDNTVYFVEVTNDRAFITEKKEIRASASDDDFEFESLPDFDEADDKVKNSVVSAPISCEVISVNVDVGQAVHENDLIAVCETMKMQFDIQALRSGIVKKICISPGTTVKSGQTIAEIGAADE